MRNIHFFLFVRVALECAGDHCVENSRPVLLQLRHSPPSNAPPQEAKDSAGLPLSADFGDVLWRGTPVRVVTVDTRGPTVTSLAHHDECNCPKTYVRNAGHGKTWNGWRTKLESFLGDLQREPANADTGAEVGAEVSRDQIVVLLDTDVIYGGCEMEEFLARYRDIVKASGASVVAGAEFNCYAPPAGDCSAYPEEHRQAILDAVHSSAEKMQSLVNASEKAWPKKGKYCEIAGAPCVQRETVPLTGPKFLNAGFMVGPEEQLARVLRRAIALFDDSFTDDQAALSTVMLESPDLLTLDYGTTLVSNLYGVSMDRGGKAMFTWDQEAGTWFHRGIERTVCFLHSSAAGGPFKALFSSQGWRA
jgi:hypothetical protein